jgi:signal transduction histidine kinase
MSRYVIARANLIAVAAWAAVLLLVGGLTWDRFAAVQATGAWIQHTDEVLSVIQRLQIGVRDVETGQRGYVLTGDEEYLDPYRNAIGTIGLLQGRMHRLTADNPGQQERLQTLAPLLQHKLDELAGTVQLRRAAGFETALRLVKTDIGRTDMLKIESVLNAMTVEEQDLLGRRLAASRQHGAWLGGLALAVAALAILALAWTARTLNSARSRSDRMEGEQRMLAARLHACLESLSQGVAVFDADGLLTNANACFQVLLRLPRSLAGAGTPYAALVTHGANDGHGQPLLETDEQARLANFLSPGSAGTYERIRPNGQRLEFHRKPMPSGGFVLTISDMTKRVQAEGVLREAQKMQAIGQLTGGIAHDFNNLLTVILGNLEMAQLELPEGHFLQNRIGRAVWASQRGATLTAQLLAFARKQPLAAAPVDLSRTVPDLIPLLTRTLGAPIDVRFVGATYLWPAMADAAQLENALLNLALNARDAMPDGGCLTLEVANQVLDEEYARSHAEVAAGDYVMLAVSDTGHGMTADVAARVFEPFFTTKPDGKGTGLGLAMVFGFVKQSRGHVKIYSEPGEGTSVKLYLPRAIGDLTAVPAGAAAPSQLARGDATVLVVEDEPSVREITVAILRDAGYRVLEAIDGNAALRIFDAHASEIDLLLTDVVLPGKLRGRDVAEHIAARRPQVKILFMSGYTENSIVHHGRLDEGVNLIGKPFKREQLAAKVADVLGRPMPSQAIAMQRMNVVPIKGQNHD